ncbi:MAG: DUF2461 domain-containing protein [Acidimicrobiia bacterium]|nr:DUF2461 domain-containing protein [Acidimicrobiia bacterium]
MAKRYFTPRLFGFLKDLAENNDREWFKANQDAYEKHIREPALEFINDFAKPLAGVSKHFVADSRTVGGSLFRIQQDTRFSKDKTPYKLNTGLQFRHVAGKDAHAPGFYLHLQPGECFMGIGLWRPESKLAYGIRQKIDDDQARWKRASRGKKFTESFELAGDSLVRPPKGFDADHPLIDDLKRKDFIASRRLRQSDITSDHFMEDFTTLCKAGGPFMKFLCEGVGVAY